MFIKYLLPMTSSVMLLLTTTSGIVLMTTSHLNILPSSSVLNCEILYVSVYTWWLSVAITPSIIFTIKLLELHVKSILGSISSSALMLHCNVSGLPTI